LPDPKAGINLGFQKGKLNPLEEEIHTTKDSKK